VFLYFGLIDSAHLGIKLAHSSLADANVNAVAKLARSAFAPIAVLLVELVMMGGRFPFRFFVTKPFPKSWG
jgi:hypothetical protein